MYLLTILFVIIAVLPVVTLKIEEKILQIPWPSGVVVDRVVDKDTSKILRFGRLQHNAISLRPEWAGVYVLENIFTRLQAKTIIDRAETYVSEFGWSRGRHVDYAVRPTKDLPVKVLFPDEGEWKSLHNVFREKIFKAMAKQYGIDADLLRIDDMFITKYDSNSSSENQLAPHNDKSPWSFVIALNDDYEGGGTYFLNLQKVFVPPVGGAVIFHGKQLHGGEYDINHHDSTILG